MTVIFPVSSAQELDNNNNNGNKTTSNDDDLIQNEVADRDVDYDGGFVVPENNAFGHSFRFIPLNLTMDGIYGVQIMLRILAPTHVKGLRERESKKSFCGGILQRESHSPDI
ncbi:unnamed protein product [Ilex paraguariensis]|uniref:Uncharacterized protein n=1 Tax=Ilex paraguariensis TaxID=185542 RepID=A0ABC8S738_9AQUA